MGRAALAAGKAPAEIADIVFKAMANDDLYILPHPAWDEFLRKHFEAVLARKGPANLDLAAMMRRRAAGEQF